MSSPSDVESKPRGLPLLGLSLGTFGVGLFIASRQNRKIRLSRSSSGRIDVENADLVVKEQLRPVARPFNAHLYALKALGIATTIVGVTAICAVGLTTWYLDVHNVEEFHSKMKPFFKKIRPKGFQDADPNQKVDWDAIVAQDTTNDTARKNSR